MKALVTLFVIEGFFLSYEEIGGAMVGLGSVTRAKAVFGAFLYVDVGKPELFSLRVPTPLYTFAENEIMCRLDVHRPSMFGTAIQQHTLALLSDCFNGTDGHVDSSVEFYILSSRRPDNSVSFLGCSLC